MKKKSIVLVAAIAVVALVAGAAFLMKSRQVSINASYDQAAQQLASAGYTVTVLTDAEELASYSADGLAAAVIAYKGSEKLAEPDEDAMANYDMMELFYFETEAQAESYYLTNDFQFGYQAWSDAFYHIGIRDFNYNFTGNIAYAGTQASIDLCA